MSSHPMDSVPMPEGTQFIAGSNRHFAKVCGTTIAFTADQLRSERISAYEMGRNAERQKKDEALRACVEALEEFRGTIHDSSTFDQPGDFACCDMPCDRLHADNCKASSAITQAQEALK